MKKIAYYVMAAAMVLATASCEKINDLITGKTTNDQGLVDDKGKKLTPDQQKSKLDETADALMADLDMNVWQKEYDTVESVMSEMGEKEVDSSEIEEKLSAIVDAWESVTGEDPFTTTTYLAKLSDLKGHFTENEDGGFDYVDADDLQVTINSNGKAITAYFTSKLSDTVITFYQSEHGSKTEEGEWTEHYTTIDKAYVPTDATLGIKVDGEELAYLSIRLNYADTNNNGWADEGDKADLGYTMRVGAYTLSVDQADYATEKASVKMNLKKDGKLIIGAEAKAALKFETIQYDESYAQETVIPVSGEVKVDVEGKIQVVGKLPSYEVLMAASDKVEEAYGNNDFEAFSKAVAELEKAYALGVYYDGKNTLQATLGFEPYKYDMSGQDLNGDGVVDEQDNVSGFGVNYVIRFQDGTSYTVEEYFSEERFGDTQDKVYNWAMNILDALGLMSKEEVVEQQ